RSVRTAIRWRYWTGVSACEAPAGSASSTLPPFRRYPGCSSPRTSTCSQSGPPMSSAATTDAETAARAKFPDALKEREERLIRERRKWIGSGATVLDRCVGLALSGGGVRSATFNLGVLQALAQHHV